MNLSHTHAIKSKHTLVLQILVITMLLMISIPVQAHTTGGATELFSGLIHPLHGFDHLLAMLAVGMWSMQQRGPSKWTIPLAFVITLLLGASLGLIGITLPILEPAIAATLLILGLIIASQWSTSPTVAALIVAFFALFHGISHGALLSESLLTTPISSTIITSFLIGLTLTTITLQSIGMALSALISKSSRRELVTGSGISIAMGGFLILVIT